ncbi:MAG: hypothetical protein ISS19_16345 [Bacteroidales bacterium]|nr:hypothetical protein [Bacteroidales bacterium]
MKLKICNYIMPVIILLCLFNCTKDDDKSDITPISKEKITGFAQKGPFNNGTSILLSELNSDFNQTGRNITSNIENNQGSYEIDYIEFISQYVLINANGYYFDEITGDNSSSQLTLYALSDLSDKNSLNINILSHLEKARVEYLLSEGKSFWEAKSQALREILEIFEMDKPDDTESENLDISRAGEGNSILLAISVIFQGYRSTADLSLLMANFITDISSDGVLDDPAVQSDLISHAQSLNLSAIRENIESHYNDIGMEYSIPDFEEYIQHFLDSSDFKIEGLIEYPVTGNYGENILCLEKDTFRPDQDYSFAANLPENGSLKIIMKNGLWFYSVSSPVNWVISDYNFSERSQVFTSIQNGVNCDLRMLFGNDSLNQNDIVIEYYEFSSEEPTRIKSITIID